MRAGDLRRRITLQTRSSTRDAAGEPAHTWTDTVTTWADIQPLSGRELELAQAISNEVSHQVTIRYRPGVTAAMRVVYQGNYFNILTVMDVDMQHKQLQMMCSQGLNSG